MTGGRVSSHAPMQIQSAEFQLGAVSTATLPVDGRPEIAFVGRSNVGKSSLINRLLRRKNIARTSSTPGKTQEINYYLINDNLFFVDLPGLGYARVSKKQRAKSKKLIGNYVLHREELRIVFHLVDSRHPPGEIDRDILHLLKQSEAVPIVLLTKTDKLSGNHRHRAVQAVESVLQEINLEVPIILTSAKDGRGRSEVLDWITSLVA